MVPCKIVHKKNVCPALCLVRQTLICSAEVLSFFRYCKTLKGKYVDVHNECMADYILGCSATAAGQ